MARLLDIFGFLSVLLRAITLAMSALVLGGLSYRYVILRRVIPQKRIDFSPGCRMITVCAIALAITQAIYIFANSAILAGTTGISLTEAAGASFFVWGCICAVAAAAIAFQSIRRKLDGYIPIVLSLIVLASTVATSHSIARVDHRPILLIATAAHQIATACWIGGLPFLLATLSKTDSLADAYELCRRFGRLAIVSVCVLASAGAVLSLFYVGSFSAVYGTNYGVMLVGKAILFGIILLLGSFNNLIVRQLRRQDSTLLLRLRRFGEAEIGIGITAILAAASLSSQPPAIDLTYNRVSWPVIVARMSPQWPRMSTPPTSSMSHSSLELWKKEQAARGSPGEAFVPGASYRPPTTNDIEWSEYNHHWSGLVVLVMGILAVLSRYAHLRWARHWPLAFVGLAIFLFLRADPENWPLGPNGFWESFSVADVTQHRLFVVLILLFAAFEWGVQNGRLTSARAALIFPLICAVGGAMLITHTHSLANVQEELLAELSHLPLALLGVIAGWTRWLELRLPGPGKVLAGRIWPVCFALIGVVLLLYREA